ncbi:unnamed protein product [Ceratitis capitata]|uniref:(Mediterranean fruit fly) hypothetical protein n=1 Tax=Ceratitis capitata TaxID=7213 RepID=A0A811V3V2_CERCA|nr:unnamed protein product [Ceratitis capitata]
MLTSSKCKTRAIDSAALNRTLPAIYNSTPSSSSSSLTSSYGNVLTATRIRRARHTPHAKHKSELSIATASASAGVFASKVDETESLNPTKRDENIFAAAAAAGLVLRRCAIATLCFAEVDILQQHRPAKQRQQTKQ